MFKTTTYSWVLNSFRWTSNRISFVEKVHQCIRSTWCSCWLFEQKRIRSRMTFSPSAVLGILSYYENVCKVQLESSMLYKWPLWSYALVQVSRLSIDAIGTIVSSHKQAKIHQCDSIICAPWSVKMMCVETNGNVYMRCLVEFEHSPPAERLQIRKWQVWSDVHFLLMSFLAASHAQLWLSINALLAAVLVQGCCKSWHASEKYHLIIKNKL